MSVIDELFTRLKSENQTAFMPFITAGDPDLNKTGELIKALDSAGCHLIELGFPYSDPIADGPVIQESYTRALNGGVTVEQIFEMVKSVRSDVSLPIVAMVSIAIIHRFGAEAFVQKSIESGFAGAIVPDLPIDESESLREICSKHDFNLVQLITPTTTEERAQQTINHSSGFIYYVSIAGITGERTALPDDLAKRLTWLREKTDTPVCVGFGISQPDQAKLLSSVADGIIVGSAFVRRINKQPLDIENVADFAKSMLAGLK